MKLNIEKGELNTDLDTPYDAENNKIDVYSSVSWTAETKEEYEAKEKIIQDFEKDNELFTMFAWCDSSGYDYWVVKQEEDNYVSIDVVLKKPAETYTQEEMQVISNAIKEADSYFEILYSFENLKISVDEIVAVTYPAEIKRQGSFGYYTEDTDSKSKEFVLECISAEKDYKYYDKYGNVWSLNEIIK